MGRAWVGRAPLSPEELQKIGPQARKWAAEQILNVWRRGKDIDNPRALWGDELEYVMVEFDPSQSRATAVLDQENVLHRWNNQISSKLGESPEYEAMDLQPEWQNFSIESTPSKPYTDETRDLLNVEKNMKRRRALIRDLLGPTQYPLTIASFPRLGTKGQFTTPHYDTLQSDVHHRMVPPQVVAPGLRYSYINQQVLGRRKRPVGLHVPIYRDCNTPRPFLDEDCLAEGALFGKDSVYLEGQAFGGACCALQTTVQAANEPDARWLHDQLVILGPTMLALTAATPIYKGYLVNTDSRWDYLTASFDIRTQEEEFKFLETSKPCCSRPLTRWSSNRVYLSHERPTDISNACGQVQMDEQAKRQLLDGGMDESIASYFSNLLWHDPLCLNQDAIELSSPETTHMFEKFQHGVWKHVHLKMPEASTGAGWRIEFRPMEVQLKDSENAAFAVFMFLLSKAIMAYRLNFYIPIELVTESMQLAQKLDAVTKERIWFRRRDWAPGGLNSVQCNPQHGCSQSQMEDTYALMTIDEIINGEHSTLPARFPGLVPIVRSYLLERDLLPNEEAKLMQYLNLISCRASGTLPTPARWMRDFVAEHDDYQQDSVVSEKICYDMLRKVVSMNEAD
ncbi:glutamate-cysteine ligase-domain-containing protein [Aspergillus pseudonomiae]|uniref:Glutamate--cysteine ligase n=1 Tax=Aspergillus pseudonomiae TaxID=1506151 RepID=A0A5N6I655_9EURO|nr:glutamate-cysteine ligase-domain-containing protein [Aspergillus pseudonomiae]KAB8261517.1 glutamate-cysteine ligase-domain-containing protein [Aspergillus pseudonomiae]KAE8400373.1 glutamate-cysteine ligase-domain-containing protein [Aspergillus pseudonomiae]